MPYAELTAVWRNGALEDGIPSNTAAVLSIPAGTDADIAATFFDSLGKRIDLDFVLPATDKLELIVRSSAGERLLTKVATKLTDGVGRYLFSFAQADTRDYRGVLIFEVYAVRSSVRRRVIDPGQLHLGLGAAQ